METTVRDEVAAVQELRTYDHVFLSEAGVYHFADRFHLKGKIHPYVAVANPGDIKGLTLNDGAKAAKGMDATVLAIRICDLLDVKYESKLGRGFQLQACCDALDQHYAARGWVAPKAE